MNILITGAVAGLGRALCEKLLDEGHNIIAIDINKDGLEELKKQRGDLLDVIQVDLTISDAVSRLIETLAKGTRFDLVVLNAGINATGNFEENPGEAYRRLLTINTETPIIMASAMIGGNMMETGGTVVFVSSLSHATGYPGASVYAASKDAIATYASSIRRACARMNINILTIFPGPIKTDHAARHAPKGADAERRMAPNRLAFLVLNAVSQRKHDLYPGVIAKLTNVAGRLLPAFLTRLMRRIVFEKLDKPTY